jgi:hypothetical protein
MERVPKSLMKSLILLILGGLSACGGGGRGGGANALPAAPTVNVTPLVPIATVASTSVNPLAPIVFTITNDNPTAVYSAQISLGSKVQYTVPVGFSNKSVVTIAAPPGAVQSVSPPAFVAGTITVALGWADASGTLQYGAPISIQVAALPAIPETLAPGTVFMTQLTATKRLMAQASMNLMSINHKAPSIVAAFGVQASNKAAQSVDAMMALTRQLQATPSATAPFGTYSGTAITLNAASLAMLDQLSAASLNVAQSVTTAAALRPAAPGTSAKRYMHMRALALASANCALEDSTCWTNEIAAGAQEVATVVGNAASSICYAAAALAVVAAAAGAAPAELAVTAGLIGTAAVFGSTAVGTAVSAAIQGGTATLMNGSASASDLLPSVDYFLTGVATNAVSAIVGLGVDELPTGAQFAYNLGQAAGNASSAYSGLTSAFSDALQAGQLPSSPVTAPTYTASMSETPSTDLFDVELTPPPTGSTALTFLESDDTTTYTYSAVTATNGAASLTRMIYSTPQPGDIVISTVTDSTGLVSATTDYDSMFPAESDTNSFPPIGVPVGGGGGTPPPPGSGGAEATFVKWTIDGIPFGPVDPCAVPNTFANVCPTPAFPNSVLIVANVDAGITFVSLTGANSGSPYTLTGDGLPPPIGAAITSANYTVSFTATSPSGGSDAVVGLNVTALTSNPPPGYPPDAGLASYGYLDAHPTATPGTMTFHFSTSPTTAPYPNNGTTAAYEYLTGTFDVMVQDDPIFQSAGISLGSHELKGSFNILIGYCMPQLSSPVTKMTCQVN